MVSGWLISLLVNIILLFLDTLLHLLLQLMILLLLLYHTFLFQPLTLPNCIFIHHLHPNFFLPSFPLNLLLLLGYLLKHSLMHFLELLFFPFHLLLVILLNLFFLVFNSQFFLTVLFLLLFNRFLISDSLIL